MERERGIKDKRAVVIGGGTGTFNVLSGLKNFPVFLSAVVSMADDGGSTGILRDQYGVLPPGDIRRALVALSRSDKILRQLFVYRFRGGDLSGHSFGNIFLSTLEKITGDFSSAVEEASKLLNIRGTVLPVTLGNTRLYAKLADGKIIEGEANIDIPSTKTRAKIKKVWLKPSAEINPHAKEAILEADLIVIGPGDLYTSLIPNLLVRGVPEAIRKSKAKKVFVSNLMTKFGETQGFGAEDFVKEIEKYLGRGVLDATLFNNKKPSAKLLKKYRREQAEFVEPPKLRNTKKPKYIITELLDPGPLIRHDSRRKLAPALISILNRKS